ncbi:MAG: tyrosine-type recombinase/integrase [Streptosporangiaceae bacterium]
MQPGQGQDVTPENEPAGGAVVELQVTDTARAAGTPGLSDGADASAVLARAGVRAGQVFVLGADGSYDGQLNRFFRELDGWGVRADSSIAAYSRDVMLFCRFLCCSRDGKSIWECDSGDLAAFKRVRLHGAQGQRVSVATWRRSISALDKWAAWALYEQLIEREPFRYIDKTVWTPSGAQRVRVNACSEPDPGPSPVNFIGFEDYLMWRDVGLRGRLPDGSADPSWRGRHDERNVVFADLLIYTGMRLSEASSLLVAELPAAGAQAGAISVAASVAKRSRARTVLAPRRLVRALHRYAAIERGELVARVAADGGYRVAGDTILVRRAGPVSVTFADGSSVAAGKLDPAARRALMLLTGDGEAAGPAALWLSTDGLPLAPSAWQSVFGRANARCARFGLDLRVSPHTLRHSFAVHMLGLLLRQTVAALGEGYQAGSLTSAQAKRLLVGNPLRKLQLLLGHRNEATVYAYLDVLDEAQEIVASALERWETQAGAAQLAGLPRLQGSGGALDDDDDGGGGIAAGTEGDGRLGALS